jgi:hypothetical protein
MGRPSSYSRDPFELAQNGDRRPEDWRAQAQTTTSRCSMPPARACVMPAIERERILWLGQQNERRKGRKGRKPPILRK